MSAARTRLEGFADQLVAERIAAIGLQLSVRRGDQELVVVRGVGGTGRPLEPRHRLRLYCAGKPIVAYAALRALDAAGIGLDDPIGPLLGEDVEGFPPHVGAYTVGQLLRHETNLVRPRGIGILSVADERMLRVLRIKASNLPTDLVGYSDVTTWVLLGRIVDRGAGGLRTAVHAAVAELGLRSTSFGLDRADALRVAAEVEVNARLDHDGPVPLLSERTVASLCRFEPAFGGYGTASDLSRLWQELGRRSRPGVDGASARAARSMVQRRRPRVRDAGLGIDCSFGTGVMVDLADHWVRARVSPAAFGHSGFRGTAFGLVEPEEDLALGCVVVGITEAAMSADLVRPALVGLGLDAGRELGAQAAASDERPSSTVTSAR